MEIRQGYTNIMNSIKILKLFALTISLFFLSGCASHIESYVNNQIARYHAPLPENVSLNPGDKVGVISFLRDRPTQVNMHVSGIRAFTKELNADWGVKQLLQNKVLEALKSTNAEIVILDSRDFDEKKITGMVLAKDGKFHIKKPKQIAEFKEKYGLKALVFIAEANFTHIPFHIPTNPLIDINVPVKHYGVFTTTPNKHQKVKLVSNYYMDIAHFDPVIAIGTKQLEKKPDTPQKASLPGDLTNEITITSIDILSTVEMAFLKNKALEIADRHSDVWAERIKATFQKQ